jgi:xanthine dehydrogenase YagS FAD-binding subunit
MKLQVETPERLVDINRLGMTEIQETANGGLRIGALATNTATANDDRVRADYPVLARAILAGATQQLRNRATTGGNLCQRTRCYYFTNIDQPCNKREPGSGCGAIDGIAHLHAVLGTSPSCIATYPGDMAVALSALDATVEIASPENDERAVPVRDFHLLPGDTPWRENVLERGEIITAVTLPRPVKAKHLYRKVRERSSYAFALVSVAAIVAVEDGVIARADLAFGGLAHKPWHDARLSELLVGEAPSAALFDKAGDLLLEGARGYGENDFKIPLARRTLAAVMAEATETEI